MKTSILRTISILKKLRANKQPLIIVTLLLLSVFYRGAYAEDSNMQNPFGVLEFLHWNHQWNNYKYATKKELEQAIGLMKEAGVGWVRMDFLWEDIEPRQGEFTFEKYDYLVDILTKNNLHILGLLNYCTSWASPSGKWNDPAQDNRLFVEYASKVVSRYKDRIKYWEVWNEPDSYVYWARQDGLKSYSVLLKEVYIALKKIDPDCQVLNGGLANGLSSINLLYDQRANDYFDILNIHFFESPLNPDAIKRVAAYPKLGYKVMSRNGDDKKKIWVTEIGCPGVKRMAKVNNWWMGKNPTERQQAEWLKSVYKELLKDNNVEKVFWAFFRDCKDHWDNGIDYFGLLRWDFSRKPAFLAFRKCFEDWKKSR